LRDINLHCLPIRDINLHCPSVRDINLCGPHLEIKTYAALPLRDIFTFRVGGK
jgi:hypothetical protein